MVSLLWGQKRTKGCAGRTDAVGEEYRLGYFFGVVAEATSDTRRVCGRPRSLARGHDKSCGPRHGAKMSLILKGDSVTRIRD